MFKGTSRQVSMWEVQTFLSDGARERLSRSWAEGFRQHVYPLLLDAESQFADLYGSRGRPNWSVARMLGCCLLQELNDLPDQVALDNLSFDTRWQHALALDDSNAYLSRRSLVEFRSRLVRKDPEMRLVRELFDNICDTAIRQLNLSTSEQRIASTLVVSNIRVRGRLGLFRQTLEHFLDELSAKHPDKLDRLSPELRAWYGRDEAWTASMTKLSTEERTKRLEQLARWLHEIIETFAKDESINRDDRYQLLVRLFAEQCELVEDDEHDDSDGAGGARVQVVTKFNKPGSNLRSPHDPDAGTGRKGVGYHVHITETCRNDIPELITDYEVVSAAHSDVGRASHSIERLEEAERLPEVLYADGGYPTPESLEDAKNAGVELYAPVHRGPMSDEKMSRQDFESNPETGDMIRCPGGHEPTRHGARFIESGRFAKHAFFDAETCQTCPQGPLCPVRTPNSKRGREYRLAVSDGLHLRDATFVKQTEPEWQQRYLIRSGVEATMSELKRAHGMDELRVRTKPRVELTVGMKVIACNIKRWLRGLSARAALAAA